jgi:1-acyl-sn-glycerol-3-phosphate acyltransferase
MVDLHRAMGDRAGREKIKEDSVYVFVCNHSNMLDIPFTGSCIDHYYKPLVKKELLSFPVLGPLLRMTSLGVDRKSPRAARLHLRRW